MRPYRYLLIGLAIASGLAFSTSYFLHFMKIKEVEKAIGFKIRGDDIEFEDVQSSLGAMGGVERVFARHSDPNYILEKCLNDKEFIHEKIIYERYFILVDDFYSRGMGRNMACFKRVSTSAQESLVIIDSNYIFLYKNQK